MKHADHPPIDWKEHRTLWFTPESEETWRLWVDAETREGGELHDVLYNPRNRMEFRARVIALWLSLRYDTMPIPVYWKQRFPRESYFYRRLDLAKIPRELLSLATALTHHAAHEVETWENSRSKADQAQEIDYLIIQLLRLRHIEAVEPLWPHLDMNDRRSFTSDLERDSGYNTWSYIMFNKDICRYWKLLADERMRQIVQCELAGEMQPREEHEDAWECYRRHIDGSIFGAERTIVRLPYSVELLAEQVQFLLSAKRAKQTQIIWDMRLPYAYRIFKSHKFRDLRRALTDNALHNTEDPFTVRSQEEMALAQHMQRDFTPAEPIFQELAEEMQRGVARIAELRAIRAQQATKKANIEALLTK